MRRLKEIFVAAVTVAAVMAACVMPVLADNPYTAVNGGTGSFKKYFVVDENVEFPSVEFTYTIVPGEAVPKASGKMEVYAGTTGATVGTADFTTAPATSYNAEQTGDSSVTLVAGQKYAKTEVDLDFTACSYTEPGVYRYKLTEVQCANEAVSCDTTDKYVDVYIMDNNGALEYQGYTIHSTTEAPEVNATAGTTGTLSDKIDGIQNEYETTELYVGKVVTGNQGSRDKYFKFTVEVTGLEGITKLNANIDKADTTSGTNLATAAANRGKTNPTEIAVDGTGKATGTFYLQNGQYVIIYGLTKDAVYTVTEDNEDYIQKAADAESFVLDSLTFEDKTSDTVVIADGPYYTGFTNSRDGVIPTGILVRVAPIAVIGVIAVAGIVLLVVRNTKRKLEDTEAEE